MVKLNSVLVFPVIVLLYDYFSIVLSDVGDRAKAECRKYGSELVECERMLKGVKTRVPADILAFPHMVMLGYKTNGNQDISYQCGGSLISPSWIISAAHCVGDRRVGDPVRARLGTTSLEIEEEEEDAVQERGLSRLIVHPDYKPPAKYNDIALLQMDQPIDMNGDVRIACLPLDPLQNNIFKAKASGFGKTQHDNMDGSKTMMHVDLDIISQQRCNKSLKSMIRRGGLLKQGILQSQICAGDLANGGKDTCQGDSGGPLQFLSENPDCVNTFPLYVIVGVTSFGRFCGFKNSPGVYTRVAFFVEWIENIVWPENELTTIEKTNNNNGVGKELKLREEGRSANGSERKSTANDFPELNDSIKVNKTDLKVSETGVLLRKISEVVKTNIETAFKNLPANVDTVINLRGDSQYNEIIERLNIASDDKVALSDKLLENNENNTDQAASENSTKSTAIINDSTGAVTKEETSFSKSIRETKQPVTDVSLISNTDTPIASGEKTTALMTTSVSLNNTTHLGTNLSGVANEDIKKNEIENNKPILNLPMESKTSKLPIVFPPLFKETSATETPKAKVTSNTKTNKRGRNWISNSILSRKNRENQL